MPLRQLGQCLSFYLDDGLFAAASKGRRFFMSKTLVLLLTALDFFLSCPRSKAGFWDCWWTVLPVS